MKIKEAIKKSGLSIRLISQKSGISESTIFSWLSGSRNPSLTMLTKLAKALNVDVKELI